MYIIAITGFTCKMIFNVYCVAKNRAKWIRICLDISSAQPSKNAVSAFQITCKLLSFTLKESWTNQQTINALHQYPLHLPHKVKTQYVILDHMQSTFFCCGKNLKKLADDQCSSITKGSTYYIRCIYIQPFIMEMDWPEIWHLMEVCFIHILRFYFAWQTWNIMSIQLLPWEWIELKLHI